MNFKPLTHLWSPFPEMINFGVNIFVWLHGCRLIKYDLIALSIITYLYRNRCCFLFICYRIETYRTYRWQAVEKNTTFPNIDFLYGDFLIIGFYFLYKS